MERDLLNSQPKSDEQLCAMAATSEQALETLLLRYSCLVRACARPFFLRGAELDDLMQEGMIGLLYASRTYKPDRGASFGTYAAACIRNRLISAVRSDGAEKNRPLNQSLPIQAHSFINAQDALEFPSPGLERSPEDLVISREEYSEFMADLTHKLSSFETQILGLYLEGLPYREIASQVRRSTKTVDNAVQRIRNKLSRQPKV